LLDDIQLNRPDILRVELIARESNSKAIQLYEKLGFKIEGRFENRISNDNNSFEADIPMAWFPSKTR
jgi:ribosomal protein S18 acetylase RimI-like enzyme